MTSPSVANTITAINPTIYAIVIMLANAGESTPSRPKNADDSPIMLPFTSVAAKGKKKLIAITSALTPRTIGQSKSLTFIISTSFIDLTQGVWGAP